MSAKKPPLQRVSKYRPGAGEDLQFSAPDICKKSCFRKQRAESLDEIDDAAHRRRQHHHIASFTGTERVQVHLIDDAELGCFFQHLRAVPAHDTNTTPLKRPRE